MKHQVPAAVGSGLVDLSPHGLALVVPPLPRQTASPTPFTRSLRSLVATASPPTSGAVVAPPGLLPRPRRRCTGRPATVAASACRFATLRSTWRFLSLRGVFLGYAHLAGGGGARPSMALGPPFGRPLDPVPFLKRVVCGRCFPQPRPSRAAALLRAPSFCVRAPPRGWVAGGSAWPSACPSVAYLFCALTLRVFPQTPLGPCPVPPTGGLARPLATGAALGINLNPSAGDYAPVPPLAGVRLPTRGVCGG